MKGEELDSDDETAEVELTSTNLKKILSQWKSDPLSVNVQAFVQTRNPYYPSQKLRQPLKLSVSESYVEDGSQSLYLRFYPPDENTVYFAYNQNKRYSTIKILLFRDKGNRQVLVLEKLFIPTPLDQNSKFSSLNGRMKPEVAPLKEGEIVPLIRSAFKELSIPLTFEPALVLQADQVGIENVHIIRSLTYRISI
ncbi:MAG: hypothetical protein JSS60_04020 [Verrucomicrobia bacterium]|nr:hypothetical protein [Verrucomicrobiota bacterium]